MQLLLLIHKKIARTFLKIYLRYNMKEKIFPSLSSNMLFQAPQSLKMNKDYSNFDKFK